MTAAYYIYQRYFNELRFLKMDEMRTTNQVEEVNKHLKEIPKEAEERRIENQPQTGKNEKAIEPF
jgi:benzoyl-CoA reductase/2-hydroxyglutaryl-CoA dehydratase subunit BcrC/BadD/HgdB